MDDLVKRAITQAEAGAKPVSSVPWEFDKPWQQPYYIYSTSEQQWMSTQPSASTQPTASGTDIDRIALYSWNIDFMLPHADSRMTAALRHLEHEHVSRQNSNTGTIIFFQECLAGDVLLIASNPWVQQHFSITDLDTSNWQSGYYGTLTLIDRRLAILDCFRVHFSQTRMQRDGLFIDVELKESTFRLCNTHLESLALEPAYRPPQMELISQYMHVDSVSGAAVAGDFNAIQDFDLHLHSDSGLKDAYLELGGREEDAEGGHTWGQQASTSLRERFGTSRMDKVFFCGGSITCSEFARFGAGIEVEDESERRDLLDLGFDRPWITDHLGVRAVFEFVGKPSGGGGDSSGAKSSL